jgi:predicted nucleic acid-binding protein
MPLVVDASVAFKWFVPEPGREAALALLDEDEPLWAPDIVLIEVANSVMGRLRGIANGEAATRAAVQRLPMIYSRLVPTAELIAGALEIAMELGHPIYDCMYLALCEAHHLNFVTADAKLMHKAAKSRHAGTFRLL